MLTYTDQTRIAQEVMLGCEPPQDESSEAKDFREKVTKQTEEAKAQGLMPDIPLDWESDLE